MSHTDSPTPFERHLIMSSDLKKIVHFWDERARTASSDCERVDSSLRTQRMRFERFLLANPIDGRSILDVGCGVGDFYAHIESRGISCNYTGVDISSEMIARSKARFPAVDFRTTNILEWQQERTHDFVVAIAIHNVKTENSWDLLTRFTRKQFQLCRSAAHLSLLTDHFTGFAPHIQPWSPADLLQLAFEITPYVSLQHDYLPHDFSITLYREAMIDTRADLRLG